MNFKLKHWISGIHSFEWSEWATKWRLFAGARASSNSIATSVAFGRIDTDSLTHRAARSLCAGPGSSLLHFNRDDNAEQIRIINLEMILEYENGECNNPSNEQNPNSRLPIHLYTAG